MKTISRRLLPIIIALFALALAQAICFAAPSAERPANLAIHIEVVEPKVFWSYPYLTADSKIKYPESIQVEWGVANDPKTTKQIVIVKGKDHGKLAITSPKNTVLDVQVVILDANNTNLGSANLQVKNIGQSELFYVGAPEFTKPVVSYDPDASKKRFDN